MTIDLLACPFCGGNSLRFEYDDIEGWIAHVQCIDCDDMLGPMSEYKYDTKEEAAEDAAERWNRRPEPGKPESGVLAEAVKVKPLQWRKYGNQHGTGWQGIGAIGYIQYIVDRGPDGEEGWFWGDRGFDTEDQAKAAAQSDYEQRILSALEVKP